MRSVDENHRLPHMNRPPLYPPAASGSVHTISFPPACGYWCQTYTHFQVNALPHRCGLLLSPLYPPLTGGSGARLIPAQLLCRLAVSASRSNLCHRRLQSFLHAYISPVLPALSISLSENKIAQIHRQKDSKHYHNR